MAPVRIGCGWAGWCFGGRCEEVIPGRRVGAHRPAARPASSPSHLAKPLPLIPRRCGDVAASAPPSARANARRYAEPCVPGSPPLNGNAERISRSFQSRLVKSRRQPPGGNAP
jgi:hypothetical protein